MNTKISVFGQEELLSHIDEPHFSHLISISNPTTLYTIKGRDTVIPDVFKSKFTNILRLHFWDAETKDHLGMRQFPKRIPKKSDVKRIIKFFNRTHQNATGYTIHCWAGVSRSSAVALGLLYMITGTEKKAIDQLGEIRPQAFPNGLIVALFDQVLGSRLADSLSGFRANWILRMKQELDIVPDNLLEELEELGEEES